MRLNADLDTPVTVHAAALDWVPSPAAGVERVMADAEQHEPLLRCEGREDDCDRVQAAGGVFVSPADRPSRT